MAVSDVMVMSTHICRFSRTITPPNRALTVGEFVPARLGPLGVGSRRASPRCSVAIGPMRDAHNNGTTLAIHVAQIAGEAAPSSA
jgi:hypothetical protein